LAVGEAVANGEMVGDATVSFPHATITMAIDDARIFDRSTMPLSSLTVCVTGAGSGVDSA
jgi:hypothetical protein